MRNTAMSSTLFRQLQNIHLELYDSAHLRVNEMWKGKMYNLTFSGLYYIIDGSATVKTAQKDVIELKKGYWYLFPSGCYLEYSCPNSMEFINFSLKLSDMNDNDNDLLRNFSVPVRLKETRDLIEFLLIKTKSDNIMDAMKIHNVIYQIILAMIEKYDLNLNLNSHALSPCVVKAMNYIHEHLSAQLTIAELTAVSYVSKSTLTKRFQRELQTTIKEYINDVIMFEAATLLVKSTLSISEISEKYGFSDQFYFSKKFKTKFGISPREFRKTLPL